MTPLIDRKSTKLDGFEQTLTQQSFKKETNINNIMSKYEKTGIIEHLREHPGTYADFSTITDYQDALNQVMTANELFMELPSQLRRKFNNSPTEFLDFAVNPENEAEMRELGLIPQPEPAPEAAPEPILPPPIVEEPPAV